MKIPHFRSINFPHLQSLVKRHCVGHRGNAQTSFGFASLDLKRSSESDLINRATIKSANVEERVLPSFIIMSDLVDYIDPSFDFHQAPQQCEEWRRMFAAKIMEQDPTLSRQTIERNYIEGLSVIVNSYWVRGEEVVSALDVGSTVRDHGGKRRVTKQKALYNSNLIGLMKEMGIGFEQVAILPHCDSFNGREPGQDFFCGASTAVRVNPSEDDTPPPGNGWVKWERWFLGGYQRKVNEDTNDCEGVTVTHLFH